MILTWRLTSAMALVLPVVLVAGCSKPEQRAQNYLERGRAALAKGDDLQARIEFTTALKFKGDILEAWRAVALIDQKYHSKQAEFGALRRIVELDPDDLDARLALRQKFVVALIYPALVTIIAIGVIAVLVTYVVPQVVSV